MLLCIGIYQIYTLIDPSARGSACHVGMVLAGRPVSCKPSSLTLLMVTRLPCPSENGKKLQASQVFRLGWYCNVLLVVAIVGWSLHLLGNYQVVLNGDTMHVACIDLDKSYSQ